MTFLSLIFLVVAAADTSKVDSALAVYKTAAQPYLKTIAENRSTVYSNDTLANHEEGRMLKVSQKLLAANHLQLFRSYITVAEQAVRTEWKNSPTNDLEEINFRILKMYKKYLEGDEYGSIGILPDEFYAKARLSVLKIK